MAAWQFLDLGPSLHNILCIRHRVSLNKLFIIRVGRWTHLIFEHYNQVLVWLNNKRHEVHTHQRVAFCDISDISGHDGPI